MTNDELDVYLRGLGHAVETVHGDDGQSYTAVRGVTVQRGDLAGQTCDIAWLRPAAEPFVMAAAVHTRPALVPMGTAGTQASGIGPEWQYWSRRFDRVPTPKTIWTHALTILSAV